MDYDMILKEKFKDLTFELVNFDNGATPESMAAYVLVSNLTKGMLKDKGSTVLDLGNYIYRTMGIFYQMVPEYNRSGEPKNSVAFYISKADMKKMPHLCTWVLKLHNHGLAEDETPVKLWSSALYRGGRFKIL